MSVTPKFALQYSHNIIEHLGLKLYQNKPTNVIAELISNSWDADAQNVWIDIQSDHLCVVDDGFGMTEEELKGNYLIIGKKKRSGENLSKQTDKQRCVMGRKGIGKLAPFGIAQKLSLITISKEEKRCYWIELDLKGMLSTSNVENSLSPIVYEPNVICDGVQLSDLPLTLDRTGEVKKFVERIQSVGHGTAIIMESLSLKKNIPLEQLKQSIGQRFTITLLREDFSVLVNDKKVNEKEALPKFSFRIPEKGLESETININGVDRKISYWVGFVEKADWSQDQAGVGVYAHGKIAQDRPFVFGLKGREIWSRYMYGVIEADWLDELDEDVVSTDRTSINWENEDAEVMYLKGAELTAKWINQFQKHQLRDNKGRVKNKLKQLPEDLRVTETEQNAISEIVCSMSPKIQKDESLQNEVIQKLTSAWTHAPSQVVIKSLWSKVKDIEDENEFIRTIDEINKHLVPESMSLSVMVSQKIFALTKLERLTKTGTEPQLQNLLEQFPWILGSDKGKVFANQAMKEVAKTAAIEGKLPAHGSTIEELKKQPDSGTRPDFTIFSDSNDSRIILVELKSPLVDLERSHLNQLRTYMGWFEDNYPNAEVYGYLIGRNPRQWQEKNRDPNVQILSWQDVCLRSRKDYVELLAAMLYGVSEFYDDVRIKKAVEFGGNESMELLKKMAESKPQLQELFERIDRKTGGTLNA
ncbi:ATP-binding protein [Vibrio parahaemolyticus]|uniref:ATP-binding protein n=1 Tax=Vibrio parahaemolyticus TaxID=670 RepID=UPI001B838E4A|nr:ATP-binding protein [Vibrio parahaemolyticus]UJW96447.1 ATP-binding protein [Vibrio parahaemolyticus]HBB9944259.1 ATP-binding protein [Vibrio parahaemolyticus]HBC3416013.1 ATP-binding protein [Vibrio parahaemolyticus]HBC3601660.1 ATP-binding protein [Vibrio parahaemolyticus]HBC3877610.1 ATP-binding protein [Vibrio parahaemolyticus]